MTHGRGDLCGADGDKMPDVIAWLGTEGPRTGIRPHFMRAVKAARDTPPSLDLAAAGTDNPAVFSKPLRKARRLQGEAIGDMGKASRDRFAATLSDADIAALRRYLTAWSARR